MTIQALHQITGILLAAQRERFIEQHRVQAEHDELYLEGNPPEDFADSDLMRLDMLGVSWDYATNTWNVSCSM
jgi:hypothetical protein